MPESRGRKKAANKRKQREGGELSEARDTKSRLQHDRHWVPWVFVPVGLLGVAWMVVYNIAGHQVPGMTALGSWNVLIALVLIVAAFIIATFWK